jgi:hypothetical protein
MEPGFKQALKEVRRQAVRPRENDEADEVAEAAVDALGREELSEQLGLNPESVKRILALQKEKQRVMEWLTSRLKNIDGKEQEYEPGSRRIVFDGQRYLWEKSDGTQEEVTLGSILTDGIWDVNYALDPETVPRNIRKRFLIEKARRLLQRELDKQIAINQTHSVFSDPRNRQGYSGLVKDRELLGTEGHLAERLVFSYLSKLSIDGDVPFVVQASNVYEDIELKIDFIIKVKARKRGVAVEGLAENGERTIGVQFTIASRRSRKLKKLQKAKERAKETGNKVEDIVLVKVPLKRLHGLFARWAVNKPPGGPDRLWDVSIKQKILRGVLKGMLDEDEIDEICGKLVPPNPFQETA